MADYTEHWRQYRKLRSLMWAIYISLVPDVFAIAVLGPVLLKIENTAAALKVSYV